MSASQVSIALDRSQAPARFTAAVEGDAGEFPEIAEIAFLHVCEDGDWVTNSYTVLGIGPTDTGITFADENGEFLLADTPLSLPAEGWIELPDMPELTRVVFTGFVGGERFEIERIL